MESASASSSKLTKATTLKALKAILKDEIEKSRSAPKFHGLPGDFPKVLVATYGKSLMKVQGEVFESVAKDRVVRQLATDLATSTFCSRRLERIIVNSGIVIAGFGEGEHFPVTCDTIVCGYLAGRPLHSAVNRSAIGDGLDSCLIPFAQKEMVFTFMYGIDPDIKRMVQDSSAELLRLITDIIVKSVKSSYPKYGGVLEKSVKNSLNSLIPELFKKWDQKQRLEYADPVMEMVASLPKDELGAMAESLVNLTKFKRRVSRQQETVGGPIDVAVITKGDGFIWMKRKHYFKPDLNPRYMKRVLTGDIK